MLTLLVMSAFSASSQAESTNLSHVHIRDPTKRPIVRVAVSEAEPYIQLNQQTAKWEGIFVDLLRVVCAYVQVECEHFEPKLQLLVDETLDGVMGTLTNGTADIGLSAVGISYSRLKHFNFIDSFFRRTYTVVVHRNHLLTVSASEFVMQALGDLVSDEVWVVILLNIFTYFLLGMLIDYFQALQRKRKPFIIRLINKWSFQILGMGLGLGGVEDFEPNAIHTWPYSKVIFLATWFLYTTIILTTMAGQLPVIFTFEKPGELPFTDIEGLLDSNYTVYGTPTAINLLNISQVPLHSKLSSRVNLLPAAPLEEENSSTASSGHKHTKYQRFLDLAKTEKSALIVNQETLLEMSYLSCDMFVAIADVGVVRVAGLLLPKNSSLREVFIRGYAQTQQNGVLQAGMLEYDHFIRISTHHKTACPAGSKVSKPAPRLRALRLDNLSFLYWLLGFCLAVCLFTFSAEQAAFRFFACKRQMRS